MSKIAKRYARALFGLIDNSSELELIESDLLNFYNETKSNNELLKKTLENPAFTLFEKKNVVKSIVEKLGMHSYSAKFLNFLASKSRLDYIYEICSLFRKELDLRIGRVRVSIFSFDKISEEEVFAIKSFFEKFLNKSVICNVKIDKSLLGGFKLEFNGLVFNGTLSAKLELLKKSFNA